MPHCFQKSGDRGRSEVYLVPPLGDPDGAVDAWYAELADYDFGRPGPASATASFTQLVWKEATA